MILYKQYIILQNVVLNIDIQNEIFYNSKYGGLMKQGFTLAEVLITLGIIGIVAAMTLPTLVAKHRKKVLHTQFLKAYSDIQNAAKRFQADLGISVYEYSQKEQGVYSSETLKSYIVYFQGNKSNSNVVTSDLNDSFEKAIGYRPKNLSGNNVISQPCDRSIVSEEVGGRFFSMDDPVSRYDNPPNGPKLCVDINGRKGPNRYGYDWFVFTFTKDGGVKPFIGKNSQNLGQDLPNPETACSYSYANATYTCAYFAITDTSPENPKEKYWTDFLN